MLVTTLDEISALLPTNTVNNPQALLTLTEEAEQNYLEPILGDELYDYLQAEYMSVMETNGSIVTGMMEREQETPQVKLIRLCQRTALYFALANNVGLLSVSINEGGGMNILEADGFQAADDKRMERFAKDAYRNAYRAVDNILALLERDAKSKEPVFADKWRTSTYYYQHTDLLFSTAIQLKHYLSSCKGRQDYIECLPDIRYCQSAYIAPELGEELLGALIRWSTDHSVVPAEPENASQIWDKAVDLLRMALGVFVMNRRADKRANFTEGEAVLVLSQALSYIKEHADSFGEVFQKSPLYVAPSTDDTTKSELNTLFDPDDGDNAFLSPFGFGVNRH